MKSPNPKILIALKKARSHTDKVIDMIERGEYCIDVIQQLNAISGYIDSARNQKLEEHLNSCFAEGMMTRSRTKKKALVDELLQALKMSK